MLEQTSLLACHHKLASSWGTALIISLRHHVELIRLDTETVFLRDALALWS